ncbi:VanZ family protein [Streptomyces sp. ISL-90]|nr:VanZ family protein [Streptomyces sp. ISL-90]
MAADAASRPTHRRRWWLVACAVAYAAALGIVLLWPVHVDGEGGLFPSRPILTFLEGFGIPAWASYPWVEFGANATLFAPLGALWVAAARDPRARDVATAAAVGAAVSVAAEAAQGLFISARTVDARDVLANAVGAVLGAVAIVALDRALGRQGVAAAASGRLPADQPR